MSHRHQPPDVVAITGGAGFIGHRLAWRLLSQGKRVTILDDYSSPYSSTNEASLRARFERRLRVVHGDVRDSGARTAALRGATVVFHLAGQPSCETSMAQPRRDFEINAKATGELVADLLTWPSPPVLVYTSGRDVYGPLQHIEVLASGHRVEPCCAQLREFGLPETTPLHFETPLGCSKASGEQHIQWAATRGVRATVIRLGAVYGPHAGGGDESEFFTDLAVRVGGRSRLFLHGDGRRVRDWLYVDDAVDALVMAAEQIGSLSGGIFHAGGGPQNAASELELVEWLGGREKSPLFCSLSSLAADPDYFVCDNRNLAALSGWTPRTPLALGVQHLRRWAGSQNRALVEGVA